MQVLRSASGSDHGRPRGRATLAALAVVSFVFATPVIVLADDPGAPVSDAGLAFSDDAVADDALAQIHGAGEGGGQLPPWDEDEPGDNGSHQSVDIGSLNGLSGFNDGNAVAVAIIHQHAVQIIGSGGIDDVTGN